MFGYSQLSAAGLPQAAVLPIIAAVGISAGSAGVGAVGEGGLVVSSAVGASAGVATVTGVGAPRAAATGEVIARAVVYDAVSAPIAASVASSSGVATVSGYERQEWTALSAYGLPYPYFQVENKDVVTYRTWQETEFAYLNVSISDVTNFTFDITEIASFGTTETAGFAGSTGFSDGVATVTGVGSALHTGASAGVATVTGVGANVITQSGVGASAGSAVGDFRSVGTTLGLGVAGSTGVATATIVGASTAAAVGTDAGVDGPSSFAAATGQAFVDAVATSAGIATVDGTPSTLSSISAAGVATVTGIGISTHAAVFSTDGSSTGTFVGSGGISLDIHQIILTPRTPQIVLSGSSSRIVLREVA